MHELQLILVALNWLIAAAAIVHVVMDNRQPAKTVAWALVIWSVPVAGVIAYIIFGVNTRRERLVSRRQMDDLTKRSMLGFVKQQDLQLPEQQKPLIDLFINQNLALPFQGNHVDILTDGYQFTHALLHAISQAKCHIHLDMYIFEDDPLGRLISDALIDKARQGVEVRVIYDDVGCWSVKSRFFERMKEAGIEVMPFLPVRFPSFTSKVNYRNHRKLIVVDGTTGFAGGMNLALRYVKGTGTQPWRDTMVQITGPGVYALQRAFLVDWYFVDRTLLSDRKYYPASLLTDEGRTDGGALLQFVTSGPTSPFPNIVQGFVRTLQTARRYVYIQTPYFLPTESVLFALKMAATAGIDVRVMVPLRSDQRFTEWASRSYLREVVQAGVKVSLYKGGFLHSKIMVSDDAVCTCGSTNVDFRSFENNFEANAFFYDEALAVRFRNMYLHDEAQSVDISMLDGFKHQGFTARLGESVARLLSPLL